MKFKLRDIVTLDLETFYSKEYSLSLKKYNLSSYVRDPQFYAQCIGIKDGTKKTVWYDHDEIPYALKKHDVANRPMMCHNTSFDGFVLSEHYGIVPPYYLCTLSMARGLHGTLTRNDLDTVSRLYGRGGKVKPAALKNVKGIRIPTPALLEALAEYMCGDTDECYAIGKMQLAVYPDAELDLIDWTVRQFCDPVLRLDAKLVQEELEDEMSGKAAKRRTIMAFEALSHLIPHDLGKSSDEIMTDVLQSADRFASALEALGVDLPYKISPSTGELTYAFAKNDLAFQDLLEHEDDRVVALVEARLATKSTGAETRARRMLELAGKEVPVAYNYCGAHTTRWSGGNKLNFQNFRRQAYLDDGNADPTSGRLRRSILAPPGHVLVVCDSSQIEARTNATLSGQLDVVEAFSQKRDLYCEFASVVYGRKITKADKLERFIGKICVLALGYGMGWKKLQATLAMGTMGPAVFIDEREARRIVNLYRTMNKEIVSMWMRSEEILTQMIHRQDGAYKCLEWDYESVWLPSGLGLHYYALNAQYDGDKFRDFTYRERGKYKKIYGGLMTENITQALARVIVGEQLLTVNKEYRCVMTTHDELVAVAPKKKAKDCLAFMLETMRTPPAWMPDVPLDAEGGYAANYSK